MIDNNGPAGGGAPPLVEIRGITKRFPGVVANEAVSLAIYPGEVQAVLGENGAGKSTLMNILAGMLQPDAGQILVDGRPVKLDSPRAALRQGIGTVYQHFTLVASLSLIENVTLGLDDGFVPDFNGVERRLGELMAAFGLAVSPRVEVRHLSRGQQQRVEIIKALLRGSRVLLLDEPTSVLAPAEVNELFQILRSLKTQGVAVVFITHKLDEALAISDRITVLHQGRRVAEWGPAELARSGRAGLTRQIIETMFGGQPPAEREISPVSPPKGEPVARCILSGVTALDDRGAVVVRQVSFQLRAGEIFGLAGVDGNGQKELVEVMAGQRPVLAGEIRVDEIPITNRGTAAARRAGIGYVTDDRLGEGSLPSLSIAENIILKVMSRPPFSRWALLNRPAIKTYAQELIRAYGIKTTGPGMRAGTLSGGNLQKLLLARELALKPRVLLCNKPTQGLDWMTTQFTLGTLRAEANRGMAILLVSSELDELVEFCDRIGVMAGGRLVDVLPRGRADRVTLGRLMLGSSG